MPEIRRSVASHVRHLDSDALDADVVVLRDEWGIPHVRAQSVRDAFFGQGFVQAEDRLGQLEHDRRRASGRWAELAGPGAVAFDVFARRCGLVRAAKREFEALPPEARAVLEAFAQGVNAFLALEEPLPPDVGLAGVRPEPFEPWHCCAVFLVRHVAFASWQRKMWRGRLVRALGGEAVARLHGADRRRVPLVVPPGATCDPGPVDAAGLGDVLVAMEELGRGAPGIAMLTTPEGPAASNAWAVHGSRTASGLPLLAGDPHRLVEIPNVYYQCHLACDEFDAVGLAFVGVPGLVHFGHSRRVAWCVTNANGDYQDLYVERFAPDDPTSYEFAGGWRRARVCSETVVVRDAPPVTLDCYETHHGPVVFGDPTSGTAIALRSPALVAPSTGLRAVVPMLCARDVDELQRALAEWVEPANNLVAADRDGAVTYRITGRIPLRSRSNSWGPVPGWTGEHEWQGYIPDDALPRAHDPESGVIVTANQRVVGPDFPHLLGIDFAPPDRAIRIHELLSSTERATVEDMAAIQRDRRSAQAGVWVRWLRALEARDEKERAALELLEAWDGVLDVDSAAAAVYVAVRDAACQVLAEESGLAEVGAPLPDEPPNVTPTVQARLWPVVTWLVADDALDVLDWRVGSGSLLATALTRGVERVRRACGDDPASWRWGRMHRVAPAHPWSLGHPDRAALLDPAPVEVGGDSDTVCMAAHDVGRSFEVTSASVARYVFDLADWERCAWVVPMGASGDARSPYHADQQAPWRDGSLVPMRYEWKGISSAASATTLLRRRS